MRFTQLLKATNCRKQGMPEEALKWSWAAFLGGWIWLFFHRQWALGAAFLLYTIIDPRRLTDVSDHAVEPFSSFSFFMSLFAPFFPWIFTGIYGLRLAWSKGCWQNVGHMRQRLKVWVGLLLLGAPIFVVVQSTISRSDLLQPELVLFWTDLLGWIVNLAVMTPVAWLLSGSQGL